MIRPATEDDLDKLVDIENRCFILDRLSRRTFRYLLTKANAETFIDEEGGTVRGYATVLYHTGTSLARLYSIAVDPDFQGRSIGKALLQRVEKAALDSDCVAMRVEVRKDNATALALYEQEGYRHFDIVEDYYEDHMEAIRLEKSLAPHLGPEMVRVPFYEQTLEFTCGPSALMMAMKGLDPSIPLDRTMELRLWRESTSIFMTSGHGGCGPFGMLLSAYNRGFDVEGYVSDDNALFVDSVRSPDKKEVIRIVQEDFLREIKRLPIKLYYGSLTIGEIQQKFEEGGIPLVLISSYRIYHEKSPHWVVVTGVDEKYIYAHDSYVDTELGKTVTDCINMPILKKDFERMARYGKAGLKAILILKKRNGQERSPE
jgi:ribosomal-protein-alanine acetyltransferase